MASPEDYRGFAAKCLELAQNASDPDDKARLIEMAQAWRALADKIESSLPGNNNK